MNQPFSLLSICRKGLVLIIRHPALWLLGILFTIPEQFLEQTVFSKDPETIQTWINTSSTSVVVRESLLVLILGIGSLFLGIVGRSGIIILTNSLATSESIPQISLRKRIYRSVFRIAAIEILFLATLAIFGLIVMIPSIIANMRNASELSDLLALAGTGLFLSMTVLALFLRQFAMLYTALSNISVRMALENGYRLFRQHIRTSFLLGMVGIFVYVAAELLLDTLSEKAGPYFANTNSFLGILWILSIALFSLTATWLWTTWTLLFRAIALPKEPESVRQSEENVVQKDAVPSLDNAS